MRRLPFAPESAAALAARYPRALAATISTANLRAGTVPSPFSDRDHVFDSDDGLRMIVAREDQGERLGVLVHVSASIAPGTSLDAESGRAANSVAWFQTLAWERFAALSGRRDHRVRHFFLDERKLPHWYVRPS